MIFIWFIPLNKTMAMRQRKIPPWGSNLDNSVIGAAPSPAIAKIVIPAQGTIALRMMAKTKTIPPSQAPSKPDGRMGKLATMNRQWMEIQRTTITCLSPKMR